MESSQIVTIIGFQPPSVLDWKLRLDVLRLGKVRKDWVKRERERGRLSVQNFTSVFWHLTYLMVLF